MTLSELARGIVEIAEQEGMVEELLPCPFCGGRAEMWRIATNSFRVYCTNSTCCSVAQQGASSEKASAAWNRRASDAPELTRLRARVAELEANASSVRAQALEEAAARIYPRNPESDWTQYARDAAYHAGCIRALLSSPPSAPPADVTPITDVFGDSIGTGHEGGIVTTANAGQIILELQDIISNFENKPPADVTRALATLFWCTWCEDKRGAVAMSEAGLIRQVDAAEYALTDLGRAALALAEKGA